MVRRWGRSGGCTGTAISSLRLTIRTFAISDGRIHLWVGGGIVWDSEPIEEVAESLVKAEPLLEAIGAPLEHEVELNPPRAARSSNVGPTRRATVRRDLERTPEPPIGDDSGDG